MRRLAVWVARLLRWVVPFLVVTLAAGELLLGPKADEAHAEEMAVARLTAEYVGKRRQAENLEAMRAQLVEARRIRDRLETMLPDKIDPGFAHLHDAARRRGLRVEEARLRDEQRREFHSRLPLWIRVEGRFHQLGAFAADLEHAPGCLVLQDLSLAPAATPGHVTLQGWVLAHRYLSDEEVAAQRKQAAKAGKK